MNEKQNENFTLKAGYFSTRGVPYVSEKLWTVQNHFRSIKYSLIYIHSSQKSMFIGLCILSIKAPLGWLSDKRVRLMTGGCEFHPRLRRLFFLAYFQLSLLQSM